MRGFESRPPLYAADCFLVPTLPRVGSWDSRRTEEFFGVGERCRMDSATNLRRNAFDSCKLSVCIWLLGASPTGFAHRLHRGSADEPSCMGDFRPPDTLCQRWNRVRIFDPGLDLMAFNPVTRPDPTRSVAQMTSIQKRP